MPHIPLVSNKRFYPGSCGKTHTIQQLLVVHLAMFSCNKLHNFSPSPEMHIDLMLAQIGLC